MNWYENKLLNTAFLQTTDWFVAWRRVGDEAYNLVENPQGYWLADSLMYEDEGGAWLFAEAFDVKAGYGKLAMLPFDGNSFDGFKLVLDTGSHLSYPFVFSHDGMRYMIPESSAAGEIALYVADDFPLGWRKLAKLLEGPYVDTTVYDDGDGRIRGYSYQVKSRVFIRFMLDMNSFELTVEERIPDEDGLLRPGGRVFRENERLLFPTQNNRYFYGQSLLVRDLSSECAVREILPVDVKATGGRAFRRLHTYSRTASFEAVDLSDYRFSLAKPFNRIARAARR